MNEEQLSPENKEILALIGSITPEQLIGLLENTMLEHYGTRKNLAEDEGFRAMAQAYDLATTRVSPDHEAYLGKVKS